MFQPIGEAMARHGIEPADIRWVNRNIPGLAFLTAPFGFEVPLPIYPHMVNVGSLLWRVRGVGRRVGLEHSVLPYHTTTLLCMF